MAGRGHLVTLFTAGDRAGRTTEHGYVTVRFRRRHADAARHERWFGRRLLPVLATGRFDVVHSLMPRDAVSAIRTRRLRGHRTVYEDMGIPDEAWWRGDAAEGARRRVVRDVDVYACMSRYALGKLTQGFGRTGVADPRRRPPRRVPTGGGPGGPADAAVLRGRRRAPQGRGPAPRGRRAAGRRRARPAGVVERSGRCRAAARRRAGGGQGAHRGAGPRRAGDQAARYARAWATVLPSIDESFGMVLAESLAAGTPIVVADHAAPPELVGPGTGAVCRVGDAASLASCLADALRLAADPATAARCRASVAHLDWDEGMAPLLEGLYRPARGSDMTAPDAKGDLQRYLQAARDALLWKLEGLAEYDVRRR